MKTKLILISVLLSAGLATSAFSAGRGKGPGSNQGNPPPQSPPAVCPQNPDCVPNPECPGPQQNPDCQPKRDGTGGPRKGSKPNCPQDGSGCPRA